MAGLLLCIIAIIIGFFYSEAREPAYFNPCLTICSIVLCAIVCGLMGLLASFRIRAGARNHGSRHRAALWYARLRKLSWLSVLGLYAVCVHLFDYPHLIMSDRWLGLGKMILVEEVMVLLPFFVFAACNLAGLYRGDKQLRGSSWNLRQYEVFYLRQFLVPIFPFLLFTSALKILAYFPRAEENLYIYHSLFTAAFALFILVLFTFAPLLFRLLWKVERLPDGPLRRRVEEMAASSAVRYRDIYIWRTGGSNIANAMVTGVFARFRYIFVTDALLARLPEEEVAAVLAHELGHAKHRHMQIYMVLAISFIAAVNAMEQQLPAMLAWAGRSLGVSMELLFVAYTFALLVIFWGVIFGFTSRRFEQAADVFAAQKVSPAVFGSALERIGGLSGGSRTMSSWRHFSIDKRVHFMEQAAAGGSLNAFKRSLRAAYAVVGVMFALGLGALIYDIYADATMSSQEICERRVRYAYQRKNFHRLLEIADRAVSSSPDWAMGYYFRAGALDELGRLEDSLTALDRVIELDPDKAYYYHARSEVLIKLKRWKEAKKALLEAIRLEPDQGQYLEKLRFVKKRIEMEKRKHGSLRGNGNPAAE